MGYEEINRRNRPRLTGQAGVYRVASELLLRGFNPRFPAIDCGSDLEVDGGIRVQVKTAHLRYNARCYPQGAYWFKFWRGGRMLRSGKVVQDGPRIFSDYCDFVILWGIEQSRFWIVPAQELDGCSLVIVGPDSAWIDASIDAINSLKSEGLTQEQIAKRLGITQITVSRRIRGYCLEPKRSVTYKVRQCEGHWDLITSAVNSITQAASILPTEEVCSVGGGDKNACEYS